MKNIIPPIALPPYKWFIGSNINLSLNRFTGSSGSDPEKGMLSRTTMAYYASLEVAKVDPENKDSPKYPVALEVGYNLVGPFGRDPIIGETLSRRFDVSFDEAGEVTEDFIKAAEDWLNEELARLCADGTITS